MFFPFAAERKQPFKKLQQHLDAEAANASQNNHRNVDFVFHFHIFTFQ